MGGGASIEKSFGYQWEMEFQKPCFPHLQQNLANFSGASTPVWRPMAGSIKLIPHGSLKQRSNKLMNTPFYAANMLWDTRVPDTPG